MSHALVTASTCFFEEDSLIGLIKIHCPKFLNTFIASSYHHTV